jgi:hypothetical protein
MCSIESASEEENAFLGKDGHYLCWDSDVEVKDGVMRISGGPGSGYHDRVVLLVPMERIRRLGWEIV